MTAGKAYLAWWLVLVASGCATGGKDGQPADAPLPRDAAVAVDASSDAAIVPVDARPIDAAMPDAGSGLFCSTNAMCTTSGECCVTLGGPMGFCAPGVVVLGQCVPQ